MPPLHLSVASGGKKIGKREKLAPCGAEGRLFLRAEFSQVQSHVRQKLGEISKILYSLRISSHLPADTENGGGDRF